jgi:hypothetical protein
MSTIEVRVGGRGSVRGGTKKTDASTKARCDLCDTDTDVVVSVTPDANGPFACKACMRSRLEAITVAVYELREGSGLPWGKVSG